MFCGRHTRMRWMGGNAYTYSLSFSSFYENAKRRSLKLYEEMWSCGFSATRRLVRLGAARLKRYRITRLLDCSPCETRIGKMRPAVNAARIQNSNSRRRFVLSARTRKWFDRKIMECFWIRKIFIIYMLNAWNARLAECNVYHCTPSSRPHVHRGSRSMLSSVRSTMNRNKYSKWINGRNMKQWKGEEEENKP